MTDNEVIKAFECCPEILSVVDCKKCPLNKGKYGCVRFALDLINRQQAENERLETYLDAQIDINGDLYEDNKTAKTAAVKEFAERLCADRVSNDPVVIAVKVELKEMG